MTAARWFWTDEGMEPNEDGEYVLAVSYVNLQRQLAERDKEIANLRARLELADALLNKERSKTK